MPVYRGAGGAGDATADASNTSAIALAAATAAELSAATASNAATTATTQGTSATASAATASSAASSATSSASSASTSAINAAASAASAATSAAAAAPAVGAAATAVSSAASASTSATNAEAAAISAAASFDSFDDRYLGAKSSDPSVDNDGNALLTGALYWNSVSNTMRAWTGSAWLVNYVPSTGFLTTSDIGTTVQAYDSNLTLLADTITPPTIGDAGKYLSTDGATTTWVTAAASFNYASLLKFQ